MIGTRTNASNGPPSGKPVALAKSMAMSSSSSNRDLEGFAARAKLHTARGDANAADADWDQAMKLGLPARPDKPLGPSLPVK